MQQSELRHHGNCFQKTLLLRSLQCLQARPIKYSFRSRIELSSSDPGSAAEKNDPNTEKTYKSENPVVEPGLKENIMYACAG